MKSLSIISALVCLNLASLAAEPTAPAAGSFKTDSDGFILNWLVLEPVRLTTVQHTETGVQAIIAREDLKDAVTALPRAGEPSTVGGTSNQWHALNSKSYLVSLTGFASEIGKPLLSVVFYGVVYANVPEEMKDARLSIGSDDDSVWWVNGKEVVGAYGVRQTSTDDNVSKRLTLNKGVNIIRFAVIQGDGPSDFCARFFDSRQKPITNITVSLDPPGGTGK